MVHIPLKPVIGTERTMPRYIFKADDDDDDGNHNYADDDDYDDYNDDYNDDYGLPYGSSLKKGKSTLHEKDDNRPESEIRLIISS